jgi:hypothetical protein
MDPADYADSYFDMADEFEKICEIKQYFYNNTP